MTGARAVRRAHDRTKRRLLNPADLLLAELGISTADGR
jgi:hypothetical protein